MQRELNRALLARRLLLGRDRLPLARALERLGGIQNQYAPNGYLRLWSCLDGLRRDDLTSALERREVVQATLLRGTIHLVSREDFWAFALAIRPAREAVAGSWRHEGGRIQTEPFGRLDAHGRRELAEEAERLAAFRS